jgi:uncharacterized membrane protein YtjA (UPF0391 family)
MRVVKCVKCFKPGEQIYEQIYKRKPNRRRYSLSSLPIEENFMLRYAAIFFVIALIAALFGFGGIAAGATEIAKILFFVFLLVTAVTLILGLIRRKP